MGAAVVHWEVRGKDPGKLQRFYGDLFGWTIDANNPMNYGLVDTGLKGLGINGGISGKSEQTPSGVAFYVQVEDLQAHLTKAEQLGGRVLMQVTTVPDMITMASFVDPEGNEIGLVQGTQKPPKPAPAKKKVAAKKKKVVRKPVKRAAKKKKR